MVKQSAGILPYRKINNDLEFFLVHPGGPFWEKKDLGSWSIPKGEFTAETPLLAAKREFKEETSISIENIPEEKFIPLTNQKLKSGKIIFAFGLEMEIDESVIKSNIVTLGKSSFPEVDKGNWFNKEIALEKINQGQRGFILELTTRLQSKG